jgi:hypothetical protein
MRFRCANRISIFLLERAPNFLLRDDAVVGECDLGIEAVRQHSFIVANRLIVDPNIPEIQARKFCDVAIILRVEAGAENVDDLYRSCLLGAGLEQLLFAGSDRPILELLFDDLQTFIDLLFVDTGAVASE